MTIAIVLLGFLRDYLFMNINWILLTLTIDRPNQALDEFHFLLYWTPREIMILKWILTFVFTGLFFMLTWRIVHLAFQNRLFNRITVLTFAGLLAVSALLYTIGLFMGLSDHLYGIIHTFMTLAQSFMPLMVLYILFKFLPGLGQTRE